MNNIEILENYVKELNENKKNHKLAYSTGFGKYWSDFGKAIENLIQENKELKEKAKNTIGLIGANYIHKDKEKEKIEELENCLQMAQQIMTVDISEDFDYMELEQFKKYLLNEIKINENLEE